jgi:tripartite-type tricarboxylate transporter receptor subunit TctC
MIHIPSVGKAFYGAFAASLLAVTSLPAIGQEFPSRAVRVVTPFPAGSGPEVALRVVAEKLSRLWGKPVVVENKPGASGFIAIETIKRAAPDGHELLQMDNAQMTAQPFLFKKLPYDLLRDFEPVTPVFRNYFFVTVPSTSRYKNMADLAQAAKAGPGAVNYGSWFVGSPGHIGAAMLETATSSRMTHIPYKEMSQLYAAVGTQEVDWAFGSAASAGGMQRAGKLRYLAVAAPGVWPVSPMCRQSPSPAALRGLNWGRGLRCLPPRVRQKRLSKRSRKTLRLSSRTRRSGRNSPPCTTSLFRRTRISSCASCVMTPSGMGTRSSG